MDAVSYPHADVQHILTEHFVCARFNTADATPAVKEIQRSFRQVWTPTLLVLDHHQIEARRSIGYFPPEEFIADLRVALGMVAMLHAKYAEAFNHFRHVGDRSPQARVAPEALYWAGVAAYQRDGKPDPLLEQWRELGSRYPESAWWMRASFIADKK
jgi:TolA-binding protein